MRKTDSYHSHSIRIIRIGKQNMSRIGKQIIPIPQGVTYKQEGNSITVAGPQGALTRIFPSILTIVRQDSNLKLEVEDSQIKEQKALWGTWASHLKNMIQGVSEGFTKALEVNGVGYKVSLTGNKLTLNVGFSHPVDYILSEGIQCKIEKNVINISGLDKQLVGQTAAEIRKIRKVEPYKGKGIKYVGEEIRRKAGKAAKGVGTGA